MKKFLSTIALVFCLIGFTPADAVLITDGGGSLWDLDLATNTSTLIGTSPQGSFGDIALDPTSGQLYASPAANTSLVNISTTNGSATIIGPLSPFNGLTFDGAGTLFGADSSLYTIDPFTGSTTLVGPIGGGLSPSGDIAFSPTGDLYMTANVTNPGPGIVPDQLVLLDPVTGVGTPIGPVGFATVWGLAFENSMLYGFTSNGETLLIDTTTGAGTLVATNGIGARGADISLPLDPMAPIPEPGRTALLLLGMFAVACRRQRA